MNILIVGHGRHGKDTVAEMIQKRTGYSFKSSSEMAAEIFIFDALKDKYGYETFEECYKDRHNHRAEWYDMICEYNKEDPARLAKEIMKANEIYVGMRDQIEIEKCMKDKVFDVVIWVEDPRKPYEDKSSFNVQETDDMYLIWNAHTLSWLQCEVDEFIKEHNLPVK